MNKSWFNKVEKKSTGLADKRRIAVIEKINKQIPHLEIPLNTPIKSQGANKAWLSSGRFKWTFVSDKNFIGNLGSCSSVFELLKADKIILRGYELMIAPDKFY